MEKLNNITLSINRIKIRQNIHLTLTRKPERSLESVFKSKSCTRIKYPPVVQITSFDESGDSRHLMRPGV